MMVDPGDDVLVLDETRLPRTVNRVTLMSRIFLNFFFGGGYTNSLLPSQFVQMYSE